MCTNNQIPHFHAKEIKAWADGAAIQYEYPSGVWNDVPGNRPSWTSAMRYRVKPKEDVVLRMSGNSFRKHCLFKNFEPVDDFQCIQVIFDGETGLLKSAYMVPI